GRWLLAPAGEVRRRRRRYREGTLVLETDFETESGAVTVVDCMPPRSAEPNLVRMVVGRRGQVPMRTEIIIRFDYGSLGPRVARGRAALADHAQGPDLRSHRRHGGSADHLAAGAIGRRAELGLPVLLGARRHLHALRAPLVRLP